MGRKSWKKKPSKRREGSKAWKIENWLRENRRMGGPTSLAMEMSAAFGVKVWKQEVHRGLVNVRWTRKKKLPVFGLSVLEEWAIFLRTLHSLWCSDETVLFVDEKKISKKEIKAAENYGYSFINTQLPIQFSFSFFFFFSFFIFFSKSYFLLTNEKDIV